MAVQFFNCAEPFRYLAAYFWASLVVNFILWYVQIDIKTRRLLNASRALFLGTLIYGSVNFHRYRIRNRPIPNPAPMYAINQPQQAYQMPTNISPLSPAYLSALAQLGASNHPDPQALANAGKYPSIHITYNYGPSQGPARLGQGHVAEDLGQNQDTGTSTSPPQTTIPPGSGAVPNRRPVAPNFTHTANPPISNYDAVNTDMNYNTPNSTITISHGGPPSYISHV